MRIDRPDGSRITVVVNIRPLKNEQGEITGAINCFYDITGKEMEQRLRNSEEQIREQAARLADESRRKDEFLAMLSHELRNPLAPIQSAVHLLKIHERGSERPDPETGAPNHQAPSRQPHETGERPVGGVAGYQRPDPPGPATCGLELGRSTRNRNREAAD